jgi:CelD/BcsL family acetyltransferase involved in cellulose biosynthesis
VRFVLSRRFEDVPVDRPQWNALAAGSAVATVFQTYEWFEAWWTAFARGRQLFLVTAWEGDDLAGIAPLMIERHKGIRYLEFVGSPNADYQDLILGSRPEAVLSGLADFLLDQRQAWDMLVLRNLPADSVTYRLLPNLLHGVGIRTTDDERIACPTLEIASRPDEARRRLNGYSFRRRINRLEQIGEIRYLRCSTRDQLEHYLPVFFEQYMERRAGSPAERFFRRPEVRKFYESLARSMLPHGWLHFSVLECGGRPVAFHFGFEFKRRLYWYKPSYDPAFARLSPGKVLLSQLIRDALERELDELDFTVGAEPFKYRYARTERTNVTLRAFARPWMHFAFKRLAWARRVVSQWRYRRRH